MNLEKTNTHFNNLSEASDYILQMVAKFMGVNTLCVTRMGQDTSLFVGAFNREEVLVKVGDKLPLFDAY